MKSEIFTRTSIDSQHPHGWKKVGNWGTWFPGNLVIWRELYEFETKKYIRNVGKCCNLGGKFCRVPGKSNIFSSHEHPCEIIAN